MDIKNISLKLESNNKVLEIGTNKSYGLLNIEGIDSPNYDMATTNNRVNDGSKVDNVKATSRTIVIEGEYKGNGMEEERKRLLSFFNIHHEGKLTLNLGSNRKTINYNVQNFKAPIVNLYTPMKFLLVLYCANPYWEDITINDIEMVSWIGGLTFPLVLPTQFAMAGGKIINIINNGDVETPVTLEISGKATNPKITNTLTGEYIKVISTLQAEDKMIITTGFGNKRVYQNNLNVSNKIDINSTFFSLNVGDNVMQFTTDDINDNANIKLSYSNRYVGV